MKISTLIFWLHFCVALLGHCFAVLIPLGTINLILFDNGLDFLTKGFLLGICYLATMYAVNHISDSASFCLLTSAENYYREKEGLLIADVRFMPRFYKKCLDLYISFTKLFKRCK